MKRGKRNKRFISSCLCYWEKPLHLSPTKTSLVTKITKLGNCAGEQKVHLKTKLHSWRPRAVRGKCWDVEPANGWASYKETWLIATSRAGGWEHGRWPPLLQASPPLNSARRVFTQWQKEFSNSDVPLWMLTESHKFKHGNTANEGQQL